MGGSGAIDYVVRKNGSNVLLGTNISANNFTLASYSFTISDDIEIEISDYQP
jgi:hypothetical protein